MITKAVVPVPLYTDGSSYRTCAIKRFIESGGKFKDLYYRFWSFYPVNKLTRNNLERLTIFYFIIKYNMKIKISINDDTSENINEIEYFSNLLNLNKSYLNKNISDISSIPLTVTFYDNTDKSLGALTYAELMYAYKTLVMSSSTNWKKFTSIFSSKLVTNLDVVSCMYDMLYSYVSKYEPITNNSTLSNKIDDALIQYKYARRLYLLDELKDPDFFNQFIQSVLYIGEQHKYEESVN